MIDIFKAAPAEMQEWLRAALAINGSIEASLAHLIGTRASQINSCANCINIHSIEARDNGETEQRLYLLSAWRNAPCFTDKERAALEWTDALTRLSEGPELADAYADLKAHFNEEEQVRITLVINVINGFNRLAHAFRLWADPAEIKARAAKVAA
jgi:AhpD family alkylhydroperoxidase